MSVGTEIPVEEQPADAAQLVSGIVERTKSVYSLPSVAAEVIQLTSNPQVDARALKDCIENDPALTAKLLKVVNSSLFGLSREVSDLNQALALLGIKPLKLLVLGFSLPEELFASVAKTQLTWFWQTSLVRAVAAREICQRYWRQSGDDAFLAGLLQDIGVLVLLDQLREPYAKFLSTVIDSNSELNQLETQFLGFEHKQLSAALFNDWKLPGPLVKAIAAEQSIESLQSKDASQDLAQVLHLASLLAELVGQHRLQVLPELLAAGAAYGKFDKEKLHEIMPDLQSKVEQLAEVLSLDLPESTSYSQVITDAHQQMALLCEEVAGELKEQPSMGQAQEARLSTSTKELQSALSDVVNRPVPVAPAEPSPSEGASTRVVNTTAIRSAEEFSTDAEHKALTFAVGACRSKRQPLSLLLISYDGQCDAFSSAESELRVIVAEACRTIDWQQAKVNAVGPERWQVILPGCDRHHAVGLTHEVFRTVRGHIEQAEDHSAVQLLSLSAGIASVTLPPRNFHPPDLIGAAQRCLYAAESSDATVVKSIEIF